MMKRRSMALMAIILIMLTSGCATVPTVKAPAGTGSMQAIDAALEKGPVFIEFGATWCSWCSLQKPIVEELAGEYPGVSFIDVDVDENALLADAFYVNGVPQMDVIVKKNADGSYLYADIDGRTTGDRKKSAIIGYTEKGPLKVALDAAVRARE